MTQPALLNFVGAGTTSLVTSGAVPYPAYGAGDLVCCVVCVDDGANPSLPASGPNGETIVSYDNISGSSIRAAHRVFYFVASTSGSSGTFTCTWSPAEAWAGCGFRIAAGNFNDASPFSARNVQFGQFRITIPSITAGATDDGGTRVCIGFQTNTGQVTSIPSHTSLFYRNQTTPPSQGVSLQVVTANAAVTVGTLPLLEWDTNPLQNSRNTAITFIARAAPPVPVTVNPTGVSGASSAGSASTSIDASATLTGVGGSSATSPVSIDAQAEVAATSAAATTATGSPSILIGNDVDVGGEDADGQVGSPSVSGSAVFFWVVFLALLALALSMLR